MTGSNNKQQVFYIHGGSAYSNYEAFLNTLKQRKLRDLPGMEIFQKWSNTLRADLGEKYEVFMPTMPNSQNAKYIEWKIWFELHFEYLQDDIIMVGWSQGGYFLVKYLLENNTPFSIKALFLVAAPFDFKEFTGEDGGDFGFDTTKVGELSENVNEIVICHSKDDFTVPYSHALEYKAALPEAELITFTDKNHFLVAEFPELLERLRRS
ncbi:MAG: hypothetical protein RLZZ230_763 [Candidatus Parcubacteria bacterium]|jgi:predicted alpha/beta hydrolase family esterase